MVGLKTNGQYTVVYVSWELLPIVDSQLSLCKTCVIPTFYFPREGYRPVTPLDAMYYLALQHVLSD